ncbi:MAG TPA: DNA-binding protein [Gammaproteobacteria bacterium]
MQDLVNSGATSLAQQITERYGLLLSQAQLAELLGRSADGLRYSLKCPSDSSTRELKACGRKVGRRIYYPSSEVARILLGSGEA